MLKRYLNPSRLLCTATLCLVAPLSALAADLVKVGVFPVSSALPYFVAKERGYFAEQGIETTDTKLMGGPPVVSALITGQIDAASNLVTYEGMNGNALKSGVATYIALYGQNAEFKMEQFVVQKSLGVDSLEALAKLDKRPLNVMSAPGPANMVIARAALNSVGLEEGKDYRLNELAMNLHMDAMLAGTFDLGYTLEPAATVLNNKGSVVTLEAGVISNRILGRETALAFAAGAALSADFIKARPDVARRFALAWGKALTDIANDPSAREYLKGNTFTPDDVAMTIPLPKFLMVSELSEQDRADFQAFIDFGVDAGVLQHRLDVARYVTILEE